jgi:hypothetical protein
MRLSSFFAILALLFSTATLAQESMPMAGGNMGKPMMATPMPQQVEDTRQVIPLTEAEIAIVAGEMRQMLATVQGITEGLANGDMQAVVEAASRSGGNMMKDLPAQIRMKFPEPFSQMGMATHKVFDQIARETKSIKNPVPVLNQLSTAMQNCVACHATYRFAAPR